MGLLEFSLTSAEPCGGEGTYYAFGFHHDKGYFIERSPQIFLGYDYEGYEAAEEKVRATWAVASRLSALAVAKLCDGRFEEEVHECKEPAFTLVDSIVFHPSGFTPLDINPVGAIPMFPNGVAKTSSRERGEDSKPLHTYEPTLFLPYPVGVAVDRPATKVIEAITDARFDNPLPYVALRGDEQLIPREP